MNNLWSFFTRLYRLGLCGTLVAVDITLILVLAIDVNRFIRAGYETASLQIPPAGVELIRALFHAFETSIFIFLFLPLLVASVRIVVTRLKLPSINWPARRIFSVHCLVTLLIAVGIVACVRMEVASGLRFAFSSTRSSYVNDSYVYSSELEYLPLALTNIVTHWLPVYVVSWHFAFLLAGIAFSYITGREILTSQRKFIREYADASKLTDCDPSYLPASTARRVAPVRPCAPPTNAIREAVDHELEAFSLGQNGRSYDQGALVKHVRETVAGYLFAQPHPDYKVRMLPDTLSCIYAAISNEEASTPIILSSANHRGINEPVTAWFGRNRRVQIVGIDDARRLESWAVQENVFLQALSAEFPTQTNAIVVLPLVSFWTGQLFAVRTLVEQIRAWSRNAIVVLDGSFLNVSSGADLGDLYGSDYLCLNVSQWLTCSESCGVLVSKKWLSFDPDWERQVGCIPANIRALSAFSSALDHSFKRSAWFNDPQSRSEILIEKFRSVIDPRLLSVVEIQGLTERTYFLAVEPAREKSWAPGFADKVREMGLDSGLWQAGPTARLTLAFPPYVDFWQAKSLAIALTQSVV